MRSVLMSWLILAVLPAQAALLENDLFTVGDGLTAVDTATQLEWLDLSLTGYDDFGLYDLATTRAEHIDAVLNSSYVTAMGFRIATAAEVETLFINTGLAGSADGCVYLEGSPGYFDCPNLNMSAAYTLDGDWGGVSCSKYIGGIPFTQSPACLEGYHLDASGTPGSVGYTGISVITDGGFVVNGPNLTIGQTIDPTLTISETSDYQGVYLVRAAVPIPAAVWLFASALAGLGLRRRAKV